MPFLRESGQVVPFSCHFVDRFVIQWQFDKLRFHSDDAPWPMSLSRLGGKFCVQLAGQQVWCPISNLRTFYIGKSVWLFAKRVFHDWAGQVYSKRIIIQSFESDLVRTEVCRSTSVYGRESRLMLIKFPPGKPEIRIPIATLDLSNVRSTAM